MIRDDGRECAIKNSLLVLNGNLQTEKPAKMQKPGAAHTAKWMNQGLYCQKIYMLSDQTSIEKEIFQQFSIGLNAAVNDFLFLLDLSNYEEFDELVADTAGT